MRWRKENRFEIYIKAKLTDFGNGLDMKVALKAIIGGDFFYFKNDDAIS